MTTVNEANTRTTLIDPALAHAGWDMHNPHHVGIEIPADGFDPAAWATLKIRLDKIRNAGGIPNTPTPVGICDYVLYSIFLQMFGDPRTNSMGWEQTEIDEVVASSQYGTSQKSNSEGRGYPMLSMGNISFSGDLDLRSLSFVYLAEDEFSKLKLDVGDIIFNRTNSTELVGKTAHWKYTLEAVIASYLVRLKLKPVVHPDFFVALLNTRYYKQLFQLRCKKAVGQSNISPTLLKEFPVLVPPLSLQQFAQIVQKHDRLRVQQREAERQTEHLFQTLLHKAFARELAVATPQAHDPIRPETVNHSTHHTNIPKSYVGTLEQARLPMD